MHQSMNMTGFSDDVDRFRDTADLEDYLRKYGLDGVELMDFGGEMPPILRPEHVRGVHLPCQSCWMPLWTGDQAKLEAEFGNRETWKQVFGGDTREALVRSLGDSLETAARWTPEYLVLHISECSMADSMRGTHSYSDEAVIDAAVELVNAAAHHIHGTPWLLFENLWYDGLTMERPEIVERLLSGIHYPKTGIMLDVGHLMHTNPALRTADEAVDYFHAVLDRFRDLTPIRGIHLHQTLSGEFCQKLHETWEPAEGDYYRRMESILSDIFQIDAHRPFLSPRIGEILHRIRPDYLTLELISRDREEHEKRLLCQRQVLIKAGIPPAKL